MVETKYVWLLENTVNKTPVYWVSLNTFTFDANTATHFADKRSAEAVASGFKGWKVVEHGFG